MRRYPNSLQLKQCRDLPSNLGLGELETVDWERLDRIAQTRPRWGMGGLAGFSRATADRVRGYDERMVVWGAEDNDFGKRIRATGGFLNWITDSEAQIFHVWHPPFLQTHPNAQKIFDQNKQYLKNDPSVIRNIAPGSIYRSIEPVVSVVVSPKNSATRLKEAIDSVLSQSFPELELIVVDDGSTDATQHALQSIDDPRLRHRRYDVSLGLTAAHDAAIRQARGRYIVFQDGDEIMLPDRLERQLSCITEGSKGAYGGWIDLDCADRTMMQIPGKEPFSLASVCFSADAPLPSTLLVEKTVFEQFLGPHGPDDSIATKIAWHGVKLDHCAAYVVLRPDPSNRTAAKPDLVKGTSCRLANDILTQGISEREIADLRLAASQTFQPAVKNPADSNGFVLDRTPDDLKISVTDEHARAVQDYATDIEEISGLLLIGRLSENRMLVQREIHGSRRDAPHARSYVRKKRALGPVGKGSSATSLLSNVTAAACLPDAALCIVLRCPEVPRLDDAICRSRDLLPEGEDIYAFVDQGAWHLAFRAGGLERMMVLKQKSRLNTSAIDLLTFDEGAGLAC